MNTEIERELINQDLEKNRNEILKQIKFKMQSSVNYRHS